MRDLAEMFGDEPDRLFCGHSVAMIKSLEVPATNSDAVWSDNGIIVAVESDATLAPERVAAAAAVQMSRCRCDH